MEAINLKANFPNKIFVFCLYFVSIFSFIFILKKSQGVLANNFSFKSCLIAVLTVFSWTYHSLAGFLIDVVGYFLITTARTVKSLLFIFCSFLLSPFSLKSSFSVKKTFLCFVYSRQRNSNYFGNFFWLGFIIKQIIDSLPFIYLLTIYLAEF